MGEGAVASQLLLRLKKKSPETAQAGSRAQDAQGVWFEKIIVKGGGQECPPYTSRLD